MNPLGSLPASTSAGASLNKVDALKIVRLVLVVLAAGFVQIVAPMLTGHKWEYNGIDFTATVAPIMTVVIESIRRYVANNGGGQ